LPSSDACIQFHNLGPRNAGSFRSHLHPDLKADFILANPPSYREDLGEYLRQDVRWKYGMPPVNSANYAWIHIASITSRTWA